MMMKITQLNTLYCRVIRETLVPLAIMIAMPIIALLFPYLIVHRKDPTSASLWNQSWLTLLTEAWLAVEWFDPTCWIIIIVTVLWTAITLVMLPGRKYYGPPTVNNFRPVYWHNAFRFYLLSMAFTLWYLNQYSVLHIYYKMPSLFAILSLIGFLVSFVMYFKGLVLPDSTGPHNMTQNPIFDFYWGIELNPQLGRYVNVKLLVICRIALWLWQWLVLVMWKAHLELYGSEYSLKQIVWHPTTVNTILVTVYLAKAFYWEDGYMQGIDLNVDRCGFMLLWGSIAFLPGHYTLPSLYLVEPSPTAWSVPVNAAILALGLFSILGTYWVDFQRQVARETDGQCTIWWHKPTLIRAKYTDPSGVTHHSVLLASGFWGMARHLNYLLEWLAYFTFALTTLTTSLVPYFLPIFLSVFLAHRVFRDEHKCSAKYGKYWHKYCELVPYRLIPYLL